MTEQEKVVIYLDKLRLYFTDVPKVMKHLEDVIKQNDGIIKDHNLMGIKAMCGSLYLCLFYINQISIVADHESLSKLTNTIQKIYMEYKPIIDKIQSELVNQTSKEFEDKGLNFIKENTTMQ